MSEQGNQNQPPIKQGVIQEEEKKVWMACRATPNCDGQEARVVFSQASTFEGGKVTRYICTKCGKPFHIPLGAVLD